MQDISQSFRDSYKVCIQKQNKKTLHNVKAKTQIAYTHTHTPTPKPDEKTAESWVAQLSSYLHTVRLNEPLRQWIREGRPQQPSNNCECQPSRELTKSTRPVDFRSGLFWTCDDKQSIDQFPLLDFYQQIRIWLNFTAQMGNIFLGRNPYTLPYGYKIKISFETKRRVLSRTLLHKQN